MSAINSAIEEREKEAKKLTIKDKRRSNFRNNNYQLEDHGLKDVLPPEYKRIMENKEILGLDVFEKPSVVASDFNDKSHIS